MKTLRYTFFCFILATASMPALGAPIPSSDFAGQMLSALKDLRGAYGDITTVQRIVGEIDSKKPVSATQDGWKDLSSKYALAAEKVSAIPLPTDFDKSAYTVSMTDLTSCKTRSASLSKLNGFSSSMQAAITSEEEILKGIDQALDEASSASKALTYLADMNLKLAAEPIYGQIFLWNWFDLQNNVSKSLAKARDALKSKKKKVSSNLELSKLQLENLKSNLTLFASAKCQLEGPWPGTCTVKGGTRNITIQISKLGSSFTCAKTSQDGSVSCNSFAFNEFTSEISFGYIQEWNGGANSNAISYRGSVSDDYRSMNLAINSGSLHNGEVWSGTCQLAR